MVDLLDCLGLNQVLSLIANVLNYAGQAIRLQDRILVLKGRVELKLVTDSLAACREIVTDRNVDLIEHVVVKVVLDGPDTGSSNGYTPSAVVK